MDVTRDRLTLAARRAYQACISQVVAYIQDHSSEPLTLEELARIAGFSPFHFHRFFAAFMGETPGEYLRRVRLEQAGGQLLKTHLSITRIGLEAGYETPAAFTKAFKTHFGMSPSAARQLGEVCIGSRTSHPVSKPKTRRMKMEPVIRTLPDQRVVYVSKQGMTDKSYSNAGVQAFRAISRFIDQHGLWDQVDACLGITPDDPGFVPPDQSRYFAGYILKPGAEITPEGEVQLLTLPAGRWAVFTHHGSYETMWQTWNAVYNDWVPSSGERLRDAPPYEIYLEDQSRVPADQLRTEICIAIQ